MANTSTPNLTERNIELLVIVVKHLEPVTVDWNIVAEEAVYKNAAVARKEWKKLKDKIAAMGKGSSGGSGGGSIGESVEGEEVKEKGKKRKAADGEGSKSTKRVKAVISEESIKDESDDDIDDGLDESQASPEDQLD